jgi:hypothetical protein
MDLVGPDAEEHRPLEDEIIPVRRAAESVKETLDNVTGQDKLKILALLAGQFRQPVTDGGSEVPGLVLAHVRDSR